MMTISHKILRPALFLLLSIALVALAVCDLMIGTTALPVSEVWAALTGNATDASHATIILKMRLPKILVAIASGMALSVS